MDGSRREKRLPALAVSRGIGIGRVVFLHGEKRHFFRLDLTADQTELELERFNTAVANSIDQLRELAALSQPAASQGVSDIFGVHQLILEESSFIKKIEEVITSEKINAESALKIVSDLYLAKQTSVADPHFREKVLDIEDVAERLLTWLSGAPSMAQVTDRGAIVVARELRPSTILELIKGKPAGLLTTRGGWTSHASILAREFKLPMVSGVSDLDELLSHGDEVIVDGINGQVIINPGRGTIEQFGNVSEGHTGPGEASAERKMRSRTLDGIHIVIRANVDQGPAYAVAKQYGAEGIGLFRSESLINSPGMIPSEDVQMSAYRDIAEAAGDHGVKIRTFDIGIDQIGVAHSAERNPSLGLRSVRLSLSNQEHFRVQIRAILRAAADRRIDIVLPMISGVGEIVRSRSIIDEEQANLEREGVPYGSPQLGAMIEVPSGVLTAPEIARKVDFLCLGTNDLVQYLLAVDRDNDAVADWYQTLHPAVIRAVKQVLAAAAGAGIPVTVCGEMAGSAFYVPLLIGLGARELSMNINSIPQVRHLIAGIKAKDAEALVDTLAANETADETEQFLRQYYLKNWNSLFPAGLLDAKHR